MFENDGRSSGLSHHAFSIKSNKSGGQSRSPTNGRNGGLSCAATRSIIAVGFMYCRIDSYGPPRTTISSKIIANE